MYALRSHKRHHNRSDEQGYSLQTLIITAVLAILAVAGGVVVLALINNSRENVESYAPVQGNPLATTTIATQESETTVANSSAKPLVYIRGGSAEEGSPITFRVGLSQPVSEEVRVAYSVAPGTTTGNTLTGYRNPGTAVVIDADMSHTDFMIRTGDDTLSEGDQHFTVKLVSVTTDNATIDTSNNTAIGIIEDNDEPQAISKEISIADAEATEGNAVIFTISASKPANADLNIEYVIEHRTTTAIDFPASATFSGTAIIHSPLTSTTISVMTEAGDNSYAGTRTFLVRLKSTPYPDGFDLDPAASTAIGTITYTNTN